MSLRISATVVMRFWSLAPPTREQPWVAGDREVTMDTWEGKVQGEEARVSSNTTPDSAS